MNISETLFSSCRFGKTKRRHVQLKCIFVKISSINTVSENYAADIFVEAMWRDRNLQLENNENEINFSNLWNPKIQIENVVSNYQEEISNSLCFDDEKKGYVVEKRRIKSILDARFDLAQFPFDCQGLSVAISTKLPANEVKLLESKTALSKLNNLNVVSSQEWDLYSHVEVTSDYLQSDISMGPKTKQIITFTCLAQRRFKYFVINNLLISTMLSILAFTSFAVNPCAAYNRLQICMVNLLSSLTYKSTLNQNLPKIPYLTYLDKIILWNISIIMLICIWHAAVAMSINEISLNSTISCKLHKNWNIDKILGNEKWGILALFVTHGLGLLIFLLIIFYQVQVRKKKLLEKDIEFGVKLSKLNEESDSDEDNDGDYVD